MLRLPFELGLALRYLRPKKNFVSVITLFCVLGVALGVAVLIVVIAVMSGFDLELRRKLIGFSAHLKVVTPGWPLEAWEKTMGSLEDPARGEGCCTIYRRAGPYADAAGSAVARSAELRARGARHRFGVGRAGQCV